jgi:hypothetical protein
VAVKKRVATDSTLAAIAAHPIRVQAFFVLCERPASASEVARELGEETNYIANHIRKLEEIGAIELVDTRMVGIIEKKFYRAVELSLLGTADSEGLSRSEREAVSMSILRFVIADIAQATGSGTFDSRPDRFLLRAPGLVDDQGFRELSALYDETYEKTVEIFGAAANRLAKSPESAISVTTTTMLYERPERNACS